MLLRHVAITKTQIPLSANCATASQNAPSQLFRKEIALLIALLLLFVRG